MRDTGVSRDFADVSLSMETVPTAAHSRDLLLLCV